MNNTSDNKDKRTEDSKKKKKQKRKMKDVKVDFKAGKIIVAKWFADKASRIGSDEYIKLHKIMKENPGFPIDVHTIKTNSAKETYKGLSYDFMRDYIKTHVTEAKKEQAKKNLEEQIYLTGCHSSMYPAVKKWFLDSFPEVKESYGKVTELYA